MDYLESQGVDLSALSPADRIALNAVAKMLSRRYGVHVIPVLRTPGEGDEKPKAHNPERAK